MMLHEAPEPAKLVSQVRAALAPGGRVLFAEPVVHVSAAMFHDASRLFARAGFASDGTPQIPICRAVVFHKS
jgi:SAM-dependent methyltransferase